MSLLLYLYNYDLNTKVDWMKVQPCFIIKQKCLSSKPLINQASAKFNEAGCNNSSIKFQTSVFWAWIEEFHTIRTIHMGKLYREFSTDKLFFVEDKNENHNLHYSFVENDEDQDILLVLLLQECGEQMFAWRRHFVNLVQHW